jgi:hypothetical protein
MADHLDFIRIRGLQSADTEVFQGASGGGTSSAAPGSPGDTTEWVGIPEETIELVEGYTTDLNEWMRGINESTARALGRSRDVTDLVPYVPNIIGGVGAIVGTGGAALPAVATVMMSQVIANLVGQAVQNYIASKDENSPANILKKAFLYEEDSTTKSILLKALLESVDGTQESRVDELIEELKALQYNNEEVDFGPFRIHLRGKVLDY